MWCLLSRALISNASLAVVALLAVWLSGCSECLGVERASIWDVIVHRELDLASTTLVNKYIRSQFTCLRFKQDDRPSLFILLLMLIYI